MADEDALTGSLAMPRGTGGAVPHAPQEMLTRYLFYERWRPVHPHPSRKATNIAYTRLRKLLATQKPRHNAAHKPFDEDYALDGGPGTVGTGKRRDDFDSLHRLGTAPRLLSSTYCTIMFPAISSKRCLAGWRDDLHARAFSSRSCYRPVCLGCRLVLAGCRNQI